MSTPTAIEIVRVNLESARDVAEFFGGEPDRNMMDAFYSVLRDAERFAALELAHLNPPFKGSIAVKVFDPERFEYVLYKGELSELADWLKNEGAK